MSTKSNSIIKMIAAVAAIGVLSIISSLISGLYTEDISNDSASNNVLGIYTSTGNRSAGPYDPSSYITGIQFDTATVRTEAPGSDNWPVTWCGDNNQYTAWGDGGGFTGTNSDGRVSFGFARVEGDNDDYVGYNIWGGKNPEVSTAAIGAKSYGVLCIDGDLYMWLQKNSVASDMYPRTWLTKSTDKGRSWTNASAGNTGSHGVEFYMGQNLIVPTFLQYDKNYSQGAGDGYVYAYFIDPECWNTSSNSYQQDSGCESAPSNGLTAQVPGKIYLARILESELTSSSFSSVTASDFEFYTSTNSSNPTWGSVSNKQPIFYDGNGVGWNLTVSYNYGIGRYILMTEHENTSVGKLGIFEGDNPWGPWRTVAYYDDGWLGSSNNTFYWQLSQKWSDPSNTGNGNEFTMVYTGTNSNDAWQTVEGAFVLSGDQQTSSTATSAQTSSQTTSSATSMPTPTSGAISNLVVNDTDNSADWSVESDFNIDRIIYGDRDYQVTELPNSLVGAQWISTANDSKAYTGSTLVSFDLTKSGTIYVGYDTRMALPTWLESWTSTGESILTTDASLALYKKDFSAQNVSLGASGESWGSMYSVVVVASDSSGSTSSVSTTSSAATSSSTASSEPRACAPDYNEDGDVDAADLSVFAENYLIDGMDCSLDLVGDDCRLDEADFAEFESAYKSAFACVSEPIAIVPIGDSITQGDSNYNSYRRQLWLLLQQAGYNVDFVGSISTNRDDVAAPNSDFDQDHESRWGYRADVINDNLNSWMSGYTADIALIHLGTNDIFQGQSVSSTVNDISNIITKLRAKNPEVIVLLAQIIPHSKSGEEAIEPFNEALPALVSELNTTQSPVILVDQYTGFNVSQDLRDNVHPTVSGENKMAAKWFEVLDDLL